jgi:hypothetical protein
VSFTPCLVHADRDGRGLIRIGHPLLDAYLELVAARARPNTVVATFGSAIAPGFRSSATAGLTADGPDRVWWTARVALWLPRCRAKVGVADGSPGQHGLADGGGTAVDDVVPRFGAVPGRQRSNPRDLVSNACGR